MCQLRLCNKRYAKARNQQACQNTENADTFCVASGKTQVFRQTHLRCLQLLIFFSLFILPTLVIADSESNIYFSQTQDCPASDTRIAARSGSTYPNSIAGVYYSDFTSISLIIHNCTREETQNEHGKLPQG